MTYAVRRPVENVYLVRERDRRRTRELLALTIAALPPMAVLFAAIWANLETVRLGYQLERMQKQRDVLVEKHRQLAMERAQAGALDRVEMIAKGSLGLGSPTPGQVVLIKDGALSSTPESPLAPAPPASANPEPVGPTAPASTEEGF